MKTKTLVTAALTRGGQVTPLLYTAGAHCLRVEVTAQNRPYPVDLLDLPSGEMTLLFPNNHSFAQLPQASATVPGRRAGRPAPPSG